MEKLEKSEEWGHLGWNRFFSQKGELWRVKDYRHLDSVFDLSALAGSLLDVGCALGDGLIYLKAKAPKVNRFAGADFSDEAIRICKNNPQLREMAFFQHDILEPFPDTYENVICLQTLEHVQKPEIAMRNLINAAKSLLIVAAPYRNRRPDADHLWSFDEMDFSDLVDLYCLDKRQKNIYWLVDKQKRGISFRRKRYNIFVEKLLNLLHSR
ncbi:MAG: methyltransferase domain-containing protein [Phycisphaerae bacterium]|jgi:2-polyprenyl-3-methyl-5-hydroxy-6-metoxy-1,4-benzoquinol methylase